ncbi:MAG: gamma-glutamyltransferase [Xanthomonadales bacterium]|nr:gamma-glutamyltransferase [Xanthomonadales bacterium]
MAEVSTPDSRPGVMKFAITTIVALLLSAAAHAANFDPEWGRDGMVVSSVAPAAEVGQKVLEQGGNAFDAAVAMSFAASVAHPFSSGLGGGMFAVTFEAETGSLRSLDAREMAPASASAKFFEKHPQTIRSGPRSVGVPGLVQGLWAVHKEHGSLPWEDLVEPAIALAEQGVRVGTWHHMVVSWVEDQLDEYPETQRIQTVEGKSPPLGWMIKQPELAETLRLVQARGEKALALGPIAAKIEAATGGVVTQLDLARYQPLWREPVRGNYRGYEIVSMPPPSSGGVLLAQMLNILERYDLAAMGKDSSAFIHLVASAMKVAFEDRAQHLGDSDYWDVPVERLVSEAYADQQAVRIRPDGQPTPISDTPQAADDAGTTQISVMDRHGNAVSMTQTINTVFGSKITVPGTGIVLNNEMDDFSIGPELPNLWEAVGSAANSVQAFKRPLSSMTPTIALKDGRPVMVVGSPMGTSIISTVLHTLINVIDFGFDAQRAVHAPRFHHQWKPDRLTLEPEFPVEVREKLEALGHELRERPFFGAAQLIVFDPENCLYWGGADGRRDSAAAGANIGAVPKPSEARACDTAAQAAQ